jgi:uncharacterized protein
MLTKPKHGVPEQRTTVGASLRANDAKFQISGIAAAYNTLSANLGGFKEKIAPGAFSRSLRTGADVKCLFNHDASRICGRVGNGTLVLSDSPEGLRFVCQLDKANPEHASYFASISRRDVIACSFAFTIPDSSCETWEPADGTDGVYGIRTLLDVDLLDASFVVYPAYPQGTQVDARAAAGTATITDEQRRAKAAAIGKLVEADKRAMDKSEVSAMEDWASARLSEHFAKLGKGWRVVHFNDKHVYAMPVDAFDDDDSACAAMSKCSRWMYGIDAHGDVTLSDQQRYADYPEEEDPDFNVEELRDRAVWKRRMRESAGIFTR